MKRFVLFAVSMSTGAAFAQAPAPAPAAPAVTVEAPKPGCKDPGAYPGRVGMLNENRRTTFLKAFEAYKTCMLNFVEERKATIKANETAARTAIEDYNSKMKQYNEEQEKSQ